jgi:hypothetical protein
LSLVARARGLVKARCESRTGEGCNFAGPLRKRQFAILRKPKWNEPESWELEEIHEKAISYIELFERSGAKKKFERRSQEMLGIFRVLNGFEEQNYNKLLLEMGITPIWYSDHSEVAEILQSILRDGSRSPG